MIETNDAVPCAECRGVGTFPGGRPFHLHECSQTTPHLPVHPLHQPEQFAPGHFWTIRETPYEVSVTCQCKWGWRWNQPWGGRDAAIATYSDHARNATGWTREESGTPLWQGSSM